MTTETRLAVAILVALAFLIGVSAGAFIVESRHVQDERALELGHRCREDGGARTLTVQARDHETDEERDAVLCLDSLGHVTEAYWR